VTEGGSSFSVEVGGIPKESAPPSSNLSVIASLPKGRYDNPHLLLKQKYLNVIARRIAVGFQPLPFGTSRLRWDVVYAGNIRQNGKFNDLAEVQVEYLSF